MSNSCIDTAFRSSKNNECYMFRKERFVVFNYAPGSNKKQVVNGPLYIKDGFPVLCKTLFKRGIDCAFDAHKNVIFIFSGNQCAILDYTPHSTKGKLLVDPPIPISRMFSKLKGTWFENGIDAAIRSTGDGVFLFKGKKYILINYLTKIIEREGYIRDGFPSLVGTVFAKGIDAAFTSHVEDEAYIFKGEYYARINIARHFIVNGRIRFIRDSWPDLSGVLQKGKK